MSKVFISFDYKDIPSKKAVENWKKQGIGADISFSSEDGQSHSSKGVEYVQKILKEKIDEAQIVLVLVGDNSHNRPWIDYEVAYAKSKGKRIIKTQLPNTTGASPKEILNEISIAFEMNAIKNAIRES